MTTTRTESRLQLSSVSKTFGSTRVLHSVAIDLRPGEVHALVGQNGCGKSTLIKILAGFHEADPGATASVDGAECRLGDPDSIHAAGVRFVHQDLGLVPSLSVVENLALGHGYATLGRAAINWARQRRRAEAAMALTGYEVDVRRMVGELRPVERTAVAIARALQSAEGNMSVLVLDEPTATMPRPEVNRMFDVVRRVRDMGVGVLYVSHHLDEVFELCDRVTVLVDGRRVATRAADTLDQRDLVELMTGGQIDESTSKAQRTTGKQVLRVQDLSGGAIEGLNLDLRAGEVVGVAGITGSGRDELCSLLFGATSRRGIVELDGLAIPSGSPSDAVAAGMALVPSNRARDGVVAGLDVRENLNLTTLGRLGRGCMVNPRRDWAQARGMIRRFGVKSPSLSAGIDELSGGNQQKVVLAKWMEAGPKVLLLDEPTQGVDIGAKADLHRLIDDTADQGTAILVCSSDEVELERLCDRVLVMRDGRCWAELDGARVVAKRLAELSLGVA